MNPPPIKPPAPPPPPPPPPVPAHSATAKGPCAKCGTKDLRLLHRVLLHNTDRRVCTSCVLLLHPSSFCPQCFELLEHPLSTQRFISCTKCPSLTHLHCLPSPPPPSSTFLCPPCSKPNFSFFPHSHTPLDKHLSRILLCASKIAAVSSLKALSLAKAKLDRTLREASLARKRAKEALDHCLILEKVKRVPGSVDVSAARNLGIVCKKEDFNGFVGVQAQNGLSVSVNKNGASGTNGNDANKLGNRDQDLERLRNCHGRVVDVSSTT
ncbi:hypothetical protein RJT34_23080 [Clitoria ternatea]|uniref:PHD-type domain-containing protein n=1 Tax=Clitoria ternatea TaxID=43366 RepID=A0AAN9FTZ1_CLITE